MATRYAWNIWIAYASARAAWAQHGDAARGKLESRCAALAKPDRHSDDAPARHARERDAGVLSRRPAPAARAPRHTFPARSLVRRFLRSFRSWKVSHRMQNERRLRNAAALVRLWTRPSCARALGAWRQRLAMVERAGRALRALLQGRVARAWRSWRALVVQRLVRRRLQTIGESRAHRATAAAAHEAFVHWRRGLGDMGAGGHRRTLARRAALRIARRQLADALTLLIAYAGLQRAASARLERGRHAHVYTGLAQGWSAWRGVHHSSVALCSLVGAGVAMWSGRGARSALRRVVATWREHSGWCQRAAAAAVRWRWPSIFLAFGQLQRAWRLGQSAGRASARIGEVRRRAGLRSWEAAAQAAVMDASLMVHAASRWRVGVRQGALAAWRARVAARTRRQAGYLLHSLEARVEGSRGTARRRAQRAALYALRGLAATRLRCDVRSAGLRRLLARLACHTTLGAWRGFVVAEAAALKAASDASPIIAGRSRLRAWRAFAASTHRRHGTASAALARWLRQHVSRAVCAWRVAAERARTTRHALQRVHVRWTHRSSAAAWRGWSDLCEARREAVAALDHALRLWSRRHVGGAWRAWAAHSASAGAARQRMRSVLHRLASQGLSRAWMRWSEVASSRLRAAGLMARASPHGAALRRALETWAALAHARVRALTACARALAGHGERMVRRVLHGWAQVAEAAETARRLASDRHLSRGVALGGLRAWRCAAGDRRRRMDAARRMLVERRQRGVARAWRALGLSACRCRFGRDARVRRRRVELDGTFNAWREAAATLGSARTRAASAALAFFGSRVPSAWHAISQVPRTSPPPPHRRAWSTLPSPAPALTPSPAPTPHAHHTCSSLHCACVTVPHLARRRRTRRGDTLSLSAGPPCTGVPAALTPHGIGGQRARAIARIPLPGWRTSARSDAASEDSMRTQRRRRRSQTPRPRRARHAGGGRARSGPPMQSSSSARLRCSMRQWLSGRTTPLRTPWSACERPGCATGSCACCTAGPTVCEQLEGWTRGALPSSVQSALVRSSRVLRGSGV